MAEARVLEADGGEFAEGGEVRQSGKGVVANVRAAYAEGTERRQFREGEEAAAREAGALPTPETLQSP
jgi:hypothetical protein